MKYYSTNRLSEEVSFKKAVVHGLAPDRGLYFPQYIPRLPSTFFNNLAHYSLADIAYEVALNFTDNISNSDLETMVHECFNFETPLIEVDQGVFALELYHGPTLAFKDVGARFMARCLGHYQRGCVDKLTILVATSGDTGGAVADGFLGVDGIDVVILYPSGKVSDLQEKQLTTLGQNITALEVKGNFDDCQRMVKLAFIDPEITNAKRLTSANSINIARMLPQSFYYFSALAQLGGRVEDVIMSVPSGNFGNLCGGLVATKMGLPIKRLVAGVNANDVFKNYMESGVYEPRESIQTLSNAMDVGDPSNFVRIMEMFENDVNKVRKAISSYSYTDAQTIACIKKVKESLHYTLDPHGSVAYLALAEEMKITEGVGVFMETAHPAKFIDTVESAIGEKIKLPEQLRKLVDLEKQSVVIENDYIQLKAFLLKN